MSESGGKKACKKARGRGWSQLVVVSTTLCARSTNEHHRKTRLLRSEHPHSLRLSQSHPTPLFFRTPACIPCLRLPLRHPLIAGPIERTPTHDERSWIEPSSLQCTHPPRRAIRPPRLRRVLGPAPRHVPEHLPAASLKGRSARRAHAAERRRAGAGARRPQQKRILRSDGAGRSEPRRGLRHLAEACFPLEQWDAARHTNSCACHWIRARAGRRTGRRCGPRARPRARCQAAGREHGGQGAFREGQANVVRLVCISTEAASPCVS